MIDQIALMATALATVTTYGQRIEWRDVPRDEEPAPLIYLARPLTATRLEDGSTRWDLEWAAIVVAGPQDMLSEQYAAQTAMRDALIAANSCLMWRIGRGALGERNPGNNSATAAVTVSIIIREGE